MRINHLRLQNFRRFTDRRFEDFHPRFNVLVGENGSGKTTILDGLAVALGIWLVEPPDTTLQNSRLSIRESDIRVEPLEAGDRTQFVQHRPVRVEAVGALPGLDPVTWVRQIKANQSRTTNDEAIEALEQIRSLTRTDSGAARPTLPIIAKYGAGRAWLPSADRGAPQRQTSHPARRWEAFYDCLSDRIRMPDLLDWFRRETTAAGRRGGRPRPGFEAVRRAVLRSLPDAEDLWFEPDLDTLVVRINGVPTSFSHFSAGQQTLLATVADIAVRIVTQNAHLLPSDQLDGDETDLPCILRETPGVVLIDELDVHLHPRWQRDVVRNLTETFPALQFFGTTHSPQILGEVPPERIMLLNEEPERPAQSFGMDSNWILERLMGGERQNSEIRERLDTISVQIDRRQLDDASRGVAQLRLEIGNTEAIQRAASLIERCRLLAR